MGRLDLSALARTHSVPPPAYPAACPRVKKHAMVAGLRPVRDGSGRLLWDLRRLRIPLSVTTAMLRRVCEQVCCDLLGRRLPVDQLESPQGHAEPGGPLAGIVRAAVQVPTECAGELGDGHLAPLGAARGVIRRRGLFLRAPLARMEGQIAVDAFLRRFPAAYLAVGPESLRWRRGLFLRGLQRLPLVL